MGFTLGTAAIIVHNIDSFARSLHPSTGTPLWAAQLGQQREEKQWIVTLRTLGAQAVDAHRTAAGERERGGEGWCGCRSC
jgi:hypothetical protein